MTYDVIDDEVVSNFMKYPSAESIDQIYDALMNFDLKRIIMTLRKQRDENSYSLKDIMTEISDRVFSDIDDKTISMAQAININKKLRDIEMNMITTSETDQQLTSIASAFIIMRSLD
jgi:hypothetical protein